MVRWLWNGKSATLGLNPIQLPFQLANRDKRWGVSALDPARDYSARDACPIAQGVEAHPGGEGPGSHPFHKFVAVCFVHDGYTLPRIFLCVNVNKCVDVRLCLGQVERVSEEIEMSGDNLIMEAIAKLWSPDDRRYQIEQHGDTAHYGPWRIHYYAPPIPTRCCDWHWTHDDFDGAPDANDNRGGHASSFAEALNMCDECEDEA